MILDLGVVVDCFGQEIGIIRRRRGKYVNGRYSRVDDEQHLACLASVQRPRDEDREQLPENQRTEEAISIYTTMELKVGRVGEEHEPDQVCFNDAIYEVVSKRNWQHQGAYSRYIAVRVGQ